MTPTTVPFYSLAHQTDPIEGELLGLWASILKSGRFTSGEYVERFEMAFAAAHGVAHAVAVSNGTSSLELMLRASGVGAGSSVVVPTNSFIATAEAVSNAGATPLFADSDPNSAGVSPESIDAAIRSDTAAIIGVHLYGTPCDTNGLMEVAASRGLAFFEDAAQAHLARSNGVPVGGIGLAGSFSFYAGKNLGAPGEGGAVTTNDSRLAATVRQLRDHGQITKYRSEIVGTNSRMSELVGASLLLKMDHLGLWTNQRRLVADEYGRRIGANENIVIPSIPDWADPVHHLFTVQVADRDSVRDALGRVGIETGMHYPVPIHLQPAYQHLGYRPGSLPAAEGMAKRTVSLPMFPGLSENEIAFVSEELSRAVG